MSFTVFRSAPFFALGVLAMVALQAMGGWWLNSGQGVLRAGVVLFALGVCMGLLRSEQTWNRAVALWAGAIAGSTGVLFRIGPGNLFPLVIGVGALLSGGFVFVGTIFGLAVRKRSRS